MEENLLPEIYEKVPATVYIFEVSSVGEWRFSYLSTRVSELYGVSREDAYTDHKALTACILPEDRESHRLSVEKAAKDCTTWVHLHRICTPKGELKWILAQASPEPLENGSVRWHGVLVDVSWYMAAENSLFELIEAYHKKIKTRREDLEKEEELLYAMKLSLLERKSKWSILGGSVPEISKLEIKNGQLTAEKGAVHESKKLTKREQEVLHLMGIGNTSKEISQKLGISIHTVSVYRSSVKKKIGTKTSSDMLRYAALRF